MEGSVEGEGAMWFVTCRRRLAGGRGQPGSLLPDPGAVRIVTSVQDGKGHESSHGGRRAMGSDAPSAFSHALSLSLPVVLPPTSWVALGKFLSLSEPQFPHL